MQSDSIQDLAKALASAQGKIKSAVKDANNPFYQSKYADLSSVWKACQEALNGEGLSIAQTISVIDQKPVLRTTLLHSSGQWIMGECPLLNQKGDMQGLGSAISYARRYSIASICGVITEDDDANSADNLQHREIPKGNTFLSEKKEGAQVFHRMKVVQEKPSKNPKYHSLKLQSDSGKFVYWNVDKSTEFDDALECLGLSPMASTWADTIGKELLVKTEKNGNFENVVDYEPLPKQYSEGPSDEGLPWPETR